MQTLLGPKSTIRVKVFAFLRSLLPPFCLGLFRRTVGEGTRGGMRQQPSPFNQV